MSARLHTILLTLLSCIAVFFATYHLTESPPVWYDDGMFTQAAINLASSGQEGLRVAPNIVEPSSKLITVGYPLIYPLAGWLTVFGVSVLSARSLMVLFILGFLLASYFFVKRLFNKELALGVLALLITLPTLYGNGKSVLGEVPGLMYLVLFLLSFHIAKTSVARRNLWFAIAGLFAGLCVVTKPTFLVLIPAIIVGVYIAWHRVAMNGKEILIAVATGTMPILLWLFLQFQAGDSLASILSYYINPYQLTNLFGVILENIRRLFVGIGPLYLLVIIGIWISAFWIRLRKREKISAEEIIAFVFSLLIIAAYTRTAGWYRYLFEAQAVSLLFFPNALLVVASTVSRFISPKRVVVGLIATLTIFGAYQVMFSSFVAESYNQNKTAFLESYFASASSTASLFVYNVPEVPIFIRGNNYYQYFEPAGWYIGREQLPVITEGKVDEIIVGTETYASMDKTIFRAYQVIQTTHDYTILKKI